MKSGIYRITCLMNGNFYIGSATNIKERLGLHKRTLNNNTHYNIYLQRAWNKYSEKYFDFDIIEYCSIEDLIEREQYYIDYMKPQFNLYLTAGSPLGYKHTEETKKKISIIHKGSKRSKETKKKMSDIQIGRIGNAYGSTWSIESKIKLSNSRTGCKNPKLSEINKNKRKLTNEEVKEIRSNKNLYNTELAKKYSVSVATILNIINYKIYKDIK